MCCRIPTVSSRFIAFHPKRVAEFAAGNPIGWYKDFLEQTVLPNAALFATLQAWGEVAVGIGLTLGLATRLTALVGLYLAVNFGLATQWMSSGQQGFHVLLVTSMIIFIGAGAGRAWGLDALLLRRADRAVGCGGSGSWVTRHRVGRRAFLGSLAAVGWASLTPRAARAEDVFTVGVVLPADAEKATELSRGAALGLDDANALAALFGKRLRLETETDRAVGQAGRALARAGAGRSWAAPGPVAASRCSRWRPRAPGPQCRRA